ncbi:MAG: hypothetical protein HFI38_00415 [Lachnospiraceae bacterium]|jgi:hypothetical protein|nr:hypothetical protein [Lachnospiraceae bacterium]
MKKQKFSFFNIGTSSLVLIFLVLCLVTFSVLSLVTARADYSMSSRTADRLKQYYQTSSRAEQILAVIDDSLAALYDRSSGESAYLAAVADTDWNEVVSSAGDALSDGVTIFLKEGETPLLEYELPMTSKQSLHVAVVPLYPTASGQGFYHIRSWKLTETSAWEPDSTLPVYQAPKQ